MSDSIAAVSSLTETAAQPNEKASAAARTPGSHGETAHVVPPAKADAPELRPLTSSERITTLDLLRGCALMGILLMNIVSFALPESAYYIPLGTPLPVFSGPHATLNTAIWMLRFVFADGKMRAIFSMLFGAGVVLLTERSERRGNEVADIYMRRNLWLTIFGVAHSYLIWNGDILFDYGVVALIFLYPLRRLRARVLLSLAAAILVAMTSVAAARAVHIHLVQTRGMVAMHAARAGEALTEQQQRAIALKSQMDERWWPSSLEVQRNVAEMRSGFLQVERQNIFNAFDTEGHGTYTSFPDVLLFMVIGMALFKLRFLTGGRSTRVYVWCAVMGFGISVSLGFTGAICAWRSGFAIVTTSAWTGIPYQLCRICGGIATISTIVLLERGGFFRRARLALAAVGKTALTNYILVSVLCQFVFRWGPMHWFGRLEYFQLYYVVLGVWAVSLAWSTAWLHYFHFGPLEWLWRSLTYWKKQPMRRQTQTPLWRPAAT